MKKLLFTIAVILFCTGYAEAQNCDSIAQNIVEQIKDYSPNDLLPYYDKKSEDWGLMSKNGIVLTQPLYYFPETFDPDFHFFSSGGCEITIMGKDYAYKAKFVEIGIASGYGQNPEIKGFSIKERINKITGNTWFDIAEFSSRFNNVYNPFLHDGKWYAVALLAQNGKRGIIDEDGNALIDFKYRSLEYIKKYKDKTQLWFYFEDENGARGFVNDKGKTKLAGELLSFADGYYNSFSLQKNDNKWGVLDLRNLKWAIKPQEKLPLESIVLVGQDPENEECYAVVPTEDGNKYLIDMQKKAYKPGPAALQPDTVSLSDREIYDVFKSKTDTLGFKILTEKTSLKEYIE